jgi:hypothetical protein
MTRLLRRFDGSDRGSTLVSSRSADTDADTRRAWWMNVSNLQMQRFPKTQGHAPPASAFARPCAEDGP